MKSGLQPTLTDVARKAGVGVATASRVVNGGAHVSPKTLKKVEAAVRSLGYQPNHAARILKGGRTKTVGLLVPSIADSFFASCAEAAEKVARQHDSLLICAVTSNDPAAEQSSLSVLMRHRPDGLMIVPSNTRSRELAAFVRQSALPIVSLDRPITRGGCFSVLTNNREAARHATEHLIGHGYKKILCFGGEPSLYTIQERLRGYGEAIEQAGLEPCIDTTWTGDLDSAEQVLAACLASPHPPDAVFALKNSATITAFQALQRLKVVIPAALALLGFDDFELAGTLHPAISVVQQPIEEVGRKAAELLFRQIENAVSRPQALVANPKPVILTSQLVLRSSCGCRRSPQDGRSRSLTPRPR